MLTEIFEEQRRYISYFFDHLDIAQIERLLQKCQQSRGCIFLTGVGKSGIVAEKIAMTLVSTGTKAFFLPALNFLHGDIGIVDKDDLVILFSKSGETEELLDLLPHLKKRDATTCAVVSNSLSRLALQADLSIVLPVEKELCPFDLAPTTSTEVQLLFGDALAIALMKSKGISLQAYKENHPSGAIGKKTTLRVEDLMIRGAGIPFCTPQDRLVDVLVELSNKKCGCLVVTDEQQVLQGIFTDGDLRRSLQTFTPAVLEKSIQDVMTRSVSSISKDALAWEALKLMQKDPKKWHMVLPVVEGQKVIGILRMHDIIHSGIS